MAAVPEVSAKANIDLEGLSGGLIVEPGETLIIKSRHRLNMSEASEVYSHLTELIPGVRIVVMDGDVQITVLPADAALDEKIREVVRDELAK